MIHLLASTDDFLLSSQTINFNSRTKFRNSFDRTLLVTLRKKTVLIHEYPLSPESEIHPNASSPLITFTTSRNERQTRCHSEIPPNSSHERFTLIVRSGKILVANGYQSQNQALPPGFAILPEAPNSSWRYLHPCSYP